MFHARIDQERVLWAAATLLERDCGLAASLVISRIIDQLIEQDDVRGVEIWLMVQERFEALTREFSAEKKN